MPRNQLFIISEAARKSLTLEEVNASCDGLKQVGLYALPYPAVDIWVSAHGYATTTVEHQGNDPESKKRLDSWVAQGLMEVREATDKYPRRYVALFGEGTWIEYRNVSLELERPCHRAFRFVNNKHFYDNRAVIDDCGQTEKLTVANALIVLLATRNAVKTVERHKCAALGIGKGKRSYEYVTTISVPRDTEMAQAEGGERGTGTEKAPHLRRGHIRHQHFGPNNEFRKLIWIAPVFVNADKGWIAQRKAYNLGSHGA